MKRAVFAASLLLLPSLVFGAGFARESVFLSKSSVTEGDSVLIHAVVQNDAAATFPGDVVFKAGDARIGSVPVRLEAGEAQAVSVSWKPAAGSHKITVELQDKAGAAVERAEETFSIQAKPKPASASASSTSAAAVESSQGIQDQIGSLSPAVQGATAPAFKFVDGGREAIADVLDEQLAQTKPKVTPLPMPGVVAGAQDVKIPDQGNWFWSIFYTLYYYLLTVLRFIVGSAGIFYPLVAIVFFFILWRTYKRFRRV